jgi:hypothetical protein
MRRLRLPVALLLATVAFGNAAAVQAPHAPPQPQATPPHAAPSKSPAKGNETLHNAVAAVVVAALTEQFDNRTIAVQLDSADVQIVSIRDRVVSGEGRMRIGADDEDWIGFRYRTLYDTLYGSAGYPELTLGGSDGERAVPNDSALVQELDARVVAALDKEFQGQQVRLQLDRINTLEAGKRFVRIDASGIADFGREGSTPARVDALYDRHENAWLRVNYELGPAASLRADEAVAAGR